MLAATAMLAASAVALERTADAAPQDTKVNLVAYSTPKEAYVKIIDAFDNSTTAGRNASFSQSYGSSGEQARAVVAGLPADVVALSLEPDVDLLVRAGKVPRTWKRTKWGGMDGYVPEQPGEVGDRLLVASAQLPLRPVCGHDVPPGASRRERVRGDDLDPRSD